MLERHNISAQWLPFQTKQENLKEQVSDESVGESHRRVRAQSRLDTHLLYAQLQNTTMNFPAQAGETDLALAALLQIESTPETFIDAAYKAYWVDNADLNNTDIISGLLSAANIDYSSWNTQYNFEQLNLEQLNTHQQEAEEAGIVDAPAFVIDDQIFIGREHLPWIETLLA